MTPRTSVLRRLIAEVLRDVAQRVPGNGTEDKDNRCALPPDPGPCKGIFKKYFFDHEKGACAGFFYGGFGGVVPFDTKTECEALCQERGKRTQ